MIAKFVKIFLFHGRHRVSVGQNWIAAHETVK